MDPDADLPPLPTDKIKKRKKKNKLMISRSRSFVAEMFNDNNKKQLNVYKNKWNTNDITLLEKMGISPKNNFNNHKNSKLSTNLHPDLREQTYLDEISILKNELESTRKNLIKAAEYGQYLIDENIKYQSIISQLRNDAAEYIAQLFELREENEMIKANQFDNNNNTTSDNTQLISIQNELNNLYNMNEIYKNENNKLLNYKNELNDKYINNMNKLETKILILQNQNHNLNNKYNASKRELNELKLKSIATSKLKVDQDEEEKMINDNMDDGDDGTDDEYKINPNINDSKYKKHLLFMLNKSIYVFKNILNDNLLVNSDIDADVDVDNDGVDIDIDSFNDIVLNVFKKLKNNSKYIVHDDFVVVNRNITEFSRRTSKSNNSNSIETLANCIAYSSDNDNDVHLNIVNNNNSNSNNSNNSNDDDNNDIPIPIPISAYEGDNEDLDNLSNVNMIIPSISDKQKQCVNSFLSQYSQSNSFNKNKYNNLYSLQVLFLFRSGKNMNFELT